MKNKTILTLAALIVSLLVLTQINQLKAPEMTDKKRMNKLIFKIALDNKAAAHFSKKISESDFSNNQIFLNSVVGTLVKYAPSGKIEPYLATSEWQSTSDKKIWKFKLRKNLFTEDGSTINAHLFKKIFEKNLYELSANSSVIDFDTLTGYNDFIKGSSSNISGLIVNSDIIEFHFTCAPSDLLELLRMPYFGLWIETSDGNLISTASYRIENFSEKSVLLTLRDNWFSIQNNSFKLVEIKYEQIDNSQQLIDEVPTIAKLPYYYTEFREKNVYLVKGLPTRFEAFVLSPYKENLFNHLQNRKTFLSKLLNTSNDFIRSHFMYPSSKSKPTRIDSDEYIENNNYKKVSFALERITYSEKEIDLIKKTLKYALPPTVDFELIFKNSDKDFFKKTDSNSYFDARITTVDIGANPDFSILHMMFCTKLGVNFPDLDSKICNLIKKYRNSSNEITQAFVDEFNQILVDQAIIIPINHYAEKWLVSEIIDPKSLPPTGMYPQFETLSLLE